MRAILTSLALGLLAGCTVVPAPQGRIETGSGAGSAPVQSAAAQPTDFGGVVRRVEPVAERLCRQRSARKNCDFNILVDTRPGIPANAYQTLDRSGRPVIVFTRALLAEMRNADEVAFVLGHESAHHIEDHIPRSQQTAASGAVLAGIVVAAAGGNSGAVEQAQRLGGFAGSRTFSKAFELEADALGTAITEAAGFDALRGSQFFARIPDPGDRFLGSHPPNADRQRIVAQTVERIR